MPAYGESTTLASITHINTQHGAVLWSVFGIRTNQLVGNDAALARQNNAIRKWHNTMLHTLHQ